jgi:hypothetical protein
MQIERTGGLGGPGGTDPNRPLPRPAAQTADAKRTGGKGAGGGTSDVKSFAKLGLQTPDVRQDAVAEARRLLESGQLSSPEAIRSAAKNLLNRGV